MPKKGGFWDREWYSAVGPGTPTIQQDAPQEMYKSKKPKEGDQQKGPTLEKKQRGANILEVKYQKVTYRR